MWNAGAQGLVHGTVPAQRTAVSDPVAAGRGAEKPQVHVSNLSGWSMGEGGGGSNLMGWEETRAQFLTRLAGWRMQVTGLHAELAGSRSQEAASRLEPAGWCLTHFGSRLNPAGARDEEPGTGRNPSGWRMRHMGLGADPAGSRVVPFPFSFILRGFRASGSSFPGTCPAQQRAGLPSCAAAD